jgi:hypothetical protein
MSDQDKFNELYEELKDLPGLAKNGDPKVVEFIDLYKAITHDTGFTKGNMKYSTLADTLNTKIKSVKVEPPAVAVTVTSSADAIKVMEASHAAELKLMEDSFQKQIQDLEDQRNTLNIMMQEVSNLTKMELELKSREIQKLELATDTGKKEVETLQLEINESKKQIQELKDQNTLWEDTDFMSRQSLKARDKEIARLTLANQFGKQDIAENEKEIQNLQLQYSAQQTELTEAQKQINEKDQQLKNLASTSDKAIEKLKQEFKLESDTKEDKIKELQQKIKDLDDEIDQLKKIKSSLEAATAGTVDLSGVTKSLQDELARKEQALLLEEKKFNTRTNELNQLANDYKLLQASSSKEIKQKEEAFDKIEAKALEQLNQIESLNKTIANLKVTIADLNKAKVDTHALELTKENAVLIKENERLKQEIADLKKLRRKSYPSTAVIPILSKIKVSHKKDPKEVKQFLAVIASAFM